METILHSIAISQVMVNYATDHGASVDVILEGTGISQAMLSDPDALIERHQEMRLIENLIAALPDRPAIGFELGLKYQSSVFGAWGFILTTSRTLRDAVALALRYIALSTAYCSVHQEINANEAAICMDPSGIPDHLRQFLLERDMGTAVQLAREMKLTGQPILRLEFTGPPLPYSARIEQLSGLPLQYQSTRNAMITSLQEAELPLPTYDKSMVRFLEGQCRVLLEQRRAAGYSGKVRERLLGRLGLIASIDDVANDLCMAPRSLRRKLEEEGTNYREILDQVRKQLSVQLLQASDMKLDELALHLGYADTASFNRAFRRWHQTSPGEYRKRQ